MMTIEASIHREEITIRLLQQTLPDDVTLAMVQIPAGNFLMGSPRTQGDPDEQPAHTVRIEGFFMSQITITQRQWKSIMKKLLPCRGKGLDLPVDRVSWLDAQRFCEKLTKTTQRPYRLPSEAEWEYACRAGTLTDFAYGDMITTDLANYVGWHAYKDGPTGEYRHGPIQAGLFAPNRFGLYDMHGNLSEWCADTWHANYVGAPSDGQPWLRGGTAERVLRGGSWHDPPGLCRSAARLKLMPSEGEDFVGFRVALSGAHL